MGRERGWWLTLRVANSLVGVGVVTGTLPLDVEITVDAKITGRQQKRRRDGADGGAGAEAEAELTPENGTYWR